MLAAIATAALLTAFRELGTIAVKLGSGLIASDWMHVTVPRLPSDDYMLTLNEGWRIEGDTIVKKDR